ncbi:MAG: 3-oxoacid CoA-transferase subunit A, partial [Butyrivibrio sp.]|nr:3-oxoacid CoA-transferase subunit A [Butyrivibrio sp.]
LKVIANDGGLPEGAYDAKTARGVGKLLEKGMIDHIVASHVGMNPLIGDGMIAGTLKCTLVPQGTLAEKIRAANYGLGGVLTATGVSTPMETEEDEEGRKKQTIEIEGKKYLLERPLRADYALCRATVCDKFGNFYCAKATKNFNYVMAGAADHVIVAAEKVVEIGEVDPDIFAVPGVVVDHIVEGEKVWQI